MTKPETRYGSGPICPHCGQDHGWDDWWHCLNDRSGFAPTGTLECDCGQSFAVTRHSSVDVSSRPLSSPLQAPKE